MFTMLVSWGCVTNYHRLGGLNKQQFIFSHFWKLDIQDQGVSRFDFSWSLTLWLPSISSHGLFSMCVHSWYLFLFFSVFFFFLFFFVFFFVLFFFCPYPTTCKSSRAMDQLNPHHSNVGFLTCWATRELPLPLLIRTLVLLD